MGIAAVIYLFIYLFIYFLFFSASLISAIWQRISLWWGDMCIAHEEVNQEDSEHNEVDGMKNGADSTGKVMHMW